MGPWFSQASIEEVRVGGKNVPPRVSFGGLAALVPTLKYSNLPARYKGFMDLRTLDYCYNGSLAQSPENPLGRRELTISSRLVLEESHDGAGHAQAPPFRRRPLQGRRRSEPVHAPAKALVLHAGGRGQDPSPGPAALRRAGSLSAEWMHPGRGELPALCRVVPQADGARRAGPVDQHRSRQRRGELPAAPEGFEDRRSFERFRPRRVERDHLVEPQPPQAVPPPGADQSGILQGAEPQGAGHRFARRGQDPLRSEL